MGLYSSTLIVPQPQKSTKLSEASCESYIGGHPRLPAEMPLPTCGLCGSIQTFFFQVAFPEDHLWRDQTISFFECTSCYDPEYDLAPLLNVELLPPEFKGFSWDNLPRDYPHALLDYIQINWKVLVFPTSKGIPREDYAVRVAFTTLKFKPALETRPSMKSRIGGEPGWAQGDVRPLNCDGLPMQFLMQWRSFYKFLIVPGAPPQNDLAFQIDPTSMAEKPYYNLFDGSFIYLFGRVIDGKYNVVVLTQRY